MVVGRFAFAGFFMNDALFSVEDQVVLVSGASRGIGKTIARAFAERGSQVVITGRDLHSLEGTAEEMRKWSSEDFAGVSGGACGKNSGGRGAAAVFPLRWDVTVKADVETLVESVMSRFGRMDTLVNVAGVNRRKPAEAITEEDYDWVLDVNLKGAFRLSQKAEQQMIARGCGCQINVVSLNTDRPLKNVLPYAMSKSALGQMTRALALEWGRYGVRVNALAPGFILTNLTQKLWADPGMQEWGRRNTPLGRLGDPCDLVGAALFLASPASSFVTGQILYVDGGFTAGWAWPIPE